MSFTSSMTLESFAAELKKTRTEKQISLMDISASTRINLKFLEAIEEGNFSILPQTYVRAFIREYAEAIGYDAKEAMKKYELVGRPKPVEKAAEPASPASQSAQGWTFRLPEPATSFLRNNSLIMILVVLGGAFLVYLVRPTSEAGPAATSIAETPFDDVVQENTAALPRSQEPVALPAVTKPAAVDSLTLEMATTDSVWMTITLDGITTKEYLFPPNRKGMWKARETFSLTMGNAGGATFRLNGQDLGTLGRRGAVVRNVIISKSALLKP